MSKGQEENKPTDTAADVNTAKDTGKESQPETTPAKAETHKTAAAKTPATATHKDKDRPSKNEDKPSNNEDKPSKSEDKSLKDKDRKSAKHGHKSKAVKTKPPADKPARGGGAIALLALALAAGSGGASYWLWQQGEQHQQALQQQLDDARQAQQQALAATEEMLRQRLDDAERSMQLRATETATAFADIQGNLNEVYRRLGNTRRDWIIAEAEYLLTQANHRLQLARDPATAATALRLADQRLRQMGEPALLPVRKEIAAELTALETLPELDRSGLSLQLAGLIDLLPKLPLVVRSDAIRSQQPAPTPPPATTLEQLPVAVWGTLKELVTIRYNERPLEPLLPPQQIQQLRQNLQLKLEQARLALLQYENGVYDANLAAAVDWLESYFDTGDSQVRSVIASLQELRKANVDPTLPDLSPSLRLLRESAQKLRLGIKENRGPKATKTPAAKKNATAPTDKKSKKPPSPAAMAPQEPAKGDDGKGSEGP